MLTRVVMFKIISSLSLLAFFLFFLTGLCYSDCRDLQERVDIIFSKLEELDNKLDKILGRLSKDSDNKKQSEVLTKKSNVQSGVVSENDLGDTEERRSYNHALSLLKNNKATEADGQFSIFIKDFPTSLMLGNAYFWKGEINFNKKNYKEASINFLKSYKADSKNKKISSGLVKLVTSLRKMEKYDQACSILTILQQDFMNVPAVKEEIQKEKKLLKDYCK